MSSSDERGEGQQQRPGQQRAHHGKERVLGGGADEGHPPVLHGGQQRVLLGLAEPVYLVDEEQRLPAGHAEFAPRVLHRGPDVLDPGGHRGQLHETPPGDLGDDVGERRLAGSRRPPQDEGHRRVVVGQLAERRAVPGQVLLPDDLVQGARAHPHRERRGGRRGLLLGFVEQAAGLGRLASICSGHTLTVTLRRRKTLHRGHFP